MPDVLASLSIAEITFVALGVMFAAIMRSFSGFGFALMAVPIFSLFLQQGEAVVIAAGLTLVVNGINSKQWRGLYPEGSLPPMAIGSVLGTAVGVLFVTSVSASQFQLWIGLSVIAACLILTRFKPSGRPPSKALSGVTGIASGLMNGAFAIPGPPAIIYVMATIKEPAQSRAYLMAFFVVSNVISLIMFAWAGLITESSLILLVVALPVMWVGDWVGIWLFKTVGGQAYRPVALGVSLLVGIATTAKALLA